MENTFDLDQFVNKIKAGEKVKCPVCEQGYVIAIPNGYACDHCKTKLNEN